MKALTFSLSTKLSHESCWGCSGSEGSVSGWEDKDSMSHGAPRAGGSLMSPQLPSMALSTPSTIFLLSSHITSAHEHREGISRCFQPEIRNYT